MTLRDNLKAVRALIAKGWTQDWYARDRDGESVAPHDSAATCYCLTGAVFAIQKGSSLDTNGRRDEREDLHAALRATLRDNNSSNSLTDFNDAKGRTRAEVLALIDRAIEAAP